jgi:hypothetical protein
MVDRLRLFLNRPLADGDRPRLFLIVVALIAGAALIFALLDDAGPSAQQAEALDRPVNPAPAATVVFEMTPAASSEESNPPAALQPSRSDITRSKRAARAFLAGYLAYTHGRGQADRVSNATPELRAQLQAERPRVPASERRRRPRLELLQSNSVGREHAHLTALVRDGERRYAVRLELAKTAAGWLVTNLER